MLNLELKDKLMQIIDSYDDNELQSILDFAQFLKFKSTKGQPEKHILSDEQMIELKKREERHLNDESKSYTWEEVKKNLISKSEL